jgi:hypothetical protein
VVMHGAGISNVISSSLNLLDTAGNQYRPKAVSTADMQATRNSDLEAGFPLTLCTAMLSKL